MASMGNYSGPYVAWQRKLQLIGLWRIWFKVLLGFEEGLD